MVICVNYFKSSSNANEAQTATVKAIEQLNMKSKLAKKIPENLKN